MSGMEASAADLLAARKAPYAAVVRPTEATGPITSSSTLLIRNIYRNIDKPSGTSTFTRNSGTSAVASRLEKAPC